MYKYLTGYAGQKTYANWFRLVELGAETPARNPYVAEMYKLALEGKLYSRSIPQKDENHRNIETRITI